MSRGSMRDVMQRFLHPDDASAVPDDPDPAKRAAGHKAREHNVEQERTLRREHALAWDHGVAIAPQCGCPVVGFNANGPVYGRAPTDFMGAIRGEPGAPWLPLVIEAKTRDRRLQRDDFEEHQRQLLAAVERAGGVSLAVIGLRDPAGCWALRWRDLEARWNRAHGGASVGAAELAGFELVDHPAGYLAAFVPGGLHA